MFYSKNGWDPFLQSELGTAGSAEPHSSSPNGRQEVPPIFVRGQRPDLVGANPSRDRSFHTFLSQGVPGVGSMGEIGIISEPTQVGLPW